MGALSRPGPTLGRKGPPVAREAGGPASSLWRWLPGLLRSELADYPGRLALVLRMTLAASLTMLVIMTFRLPGAAIAAYYTLVLARDSPLNTARAAATVIVAYLCGAAYTLLCITLLVDFPLTHFLWVVVSLWLCFFIIKVTTNYVGGAAFAFIITIAIPIWDTGLPTGAMVVSTLWSAGSVSVGLICTLLVEFGFSFFQIKNEVQSGVSDRLLAVAVLLHSRADTTRPSEQQVERVQHLAMVGVSRLRQMVASSGSTTARPLVERQATAVSLVGRLVDLAASSGENTAEIPNENRQQALRVATKLSAIVNHLHRPNRISAPATSNPEGSDPLLNEIERTTGLLQLSLVAEQTSDEEGGGNYDSDSRGYFVSDALTNREHLVYALRGCLAATLSYIILNAIAWRGLSTALATCVITALTSVGASRQKQILRLSGAVVGGLVFGIGSQVLILPMLDSIAGFTVLFATLTFLAAWIGTSSPRLSYFGQQIALAFFLIHLQEPFPQISLAIARDRVMGVALGLCMMWLVFDTLGSQPAARVMRALFVENLRLLAQLARPWPSPNGADRSRLRGLRDRISSNFTSVNSQADAALFEFGPSRERDLIARNRLLGWQPRLRSAFLLQISLIHYRMEVKPAELPGAICEAQASFDAAVGETWEAIAEHIDSGHEAVVTPRVQEQYDRLQKAVEDAYNGKPTQRAQGVLVYSARLAQILEDLKAEMLAGRSS